MMSEIEKNLIIDYKNMQKLIENQQFKVKDANDFLMKFYNIIRKIQDLETSRNLWKEKYNNLKNKKGD